MLSFSRTTKQNWYNKGLIDTSPDMRNQLLNAGVGSLDGVVYTHSHADHVHGLDDLRMIFFNMRTRINVWADQSTQNDLIERFKYAFVQPEASPYPPILNLNTIKGITSIEGNGGPLTCLLYTSPSPRDLSTSRMPSSA